MTTGTTGDDVLTNDVSVANEVVDALGGNDTITVNRPNPSAAGSYSARSVTVNGDSGFDTLILQASQLISLNGTGLDRTAMLREGGAGAWTLNFTSVERLEITAGIYGNAPTVITGDSVDIFRFHASIGANNTRLETGGGDDDVRLSGANFTGTTRIDTGSGNDVIDLRPILSNPFLIVADGGDGNDIIYGSLVADDLKGGAGNDILDGGAGDDFLRLQDGGDDIALGGAGNDVFLFGGALASGDQATGGVGIDQIVVQGNYAGPQALVLGANVASIENLAVLAGSDTRFGDPGTNFYDYEISVLNEAVAAGIQLVVDASPLRPGEDLTFNGSAESDASFFIYGGGGNDHLTGGANNDVFIFGHQGQWGSGDVVNGGPGGIDQLGLRGNYTIVFGAGQLIGIEQIGMVSAQDTRYGPLGSSYSYDLTMVDANVDSIQMTVDAAPLRPDETLTFNGSAEDDGSFRIFGGRGADVIGGSQNADTLVGRDGADMLTGNGGNDVFRYNNTGESVSGARDKILDFGAGDLVDLSRIDADIFTAGNQAFTFIGDTAFGNVAGQLRYQSNGGTEWLIQGDIDGNGSADFELILNIPVAHTITSADFIL